MDLTISSWIIELKFLFLPLNPSTHTKLPINLFNYIYNNFCVYHVSISHDWFGNFVWTLWIIWCVVDAMVWWTYRRRWAPAWPEANVAGSVRCTVANRNCYRSWYRGQSNHTRTWNTMEIMPACLRLGIHRSWYCKNFSYFKCWWSFCKFTYTSLRIEFFHKLPYEASLELLIYEVFCFWY